jgi:hypothetical protein
MQQIHWVENPDQAEIRTLASCFLMLRVEPGASPASPVPQAQSVGGPADSDHGREAAINS